MLPQLLLLLVLKDMLSSRLLLVLVQHVKLPLPVGVTPAMESVGCRKVLQSLGNASKS